MHRFFFFLFLNLYLIGFTQDYKTIFETSNGKETATYEQTIAFYQILANKYPQISLIEKGKTDSGKPLHLVIYNSDENFDFKKISKSKILINNGIHPGEPDGIDASMLLLRDIVQKENLKNKFTDIVICIIPIYNVGGSLNRNTISRVNQNGPVSYGFRGNARNYDLNRDFIKNDTRNSQTFTEIFHEINPDVFIDNHVSNGADYQYTLTHLFTQHNKLGGELGIFLNSKMEYEIESDLKKKNLFISPYVNVFNDVPEKGFSQFFDLPRYSSGYTTLFNTLGMMVETHMLKPYSDRVNATYEFMLSTLQFLQKNGKEIKILRDQATNSILSKGKYPIHWEIDSTKYDILIFKGFEGHFETSKITGLNRLKYDQSKPTTNPVTYYNSFKPKHEVIIPKAYIISKSWWRVIDLLKLNNIEIHTLKKDTILAVESYQIEDYKTVKKPFEGHFLHSDTKVSKSIIEHSFEKGDYYIPLEQNGLRYLLETLEPEAKDSFFNWNFFDTILQRKEGFSPYVFEELALEILNDNSELKADFEQKKRADDGFANSWYEQLDYIYKHSVYLEKAYLQYPVYRVLNN
jgi:hypothetical protein